MNMLIILSAKYLYLVSILIAVAYFLKANKDIKKKIFLLALVSFPLSLILSKISSFFIKDPRPFVVEHIKPLIAHAADNGFPSDHTLLTMAIASVVFAYNKKLGAVLFVITFLVGAARVLAYVHHPLDIIGSIVIAGGVTIIVFFLMRFTLKSFRHYS